MENHFRIIDLLVDRNTPNTKGPAMITLKGSPILPSDDCFPRARISVSLLKHDSAESLLSFSSRDYSWIKHRCRVDHTLKAYYALGTKGVVLGDSR